MSTIKVACFFSGTRCILHTAAQLADKTLLLFVWKCLSSASLRALPGGSITPIYETAMMTVTMSQNVINSYTGTQ